MRSCPTSDSGMRRPHHSAPDSVMCTVTVVPHDRGVRLLANRDERRARLPGLPPRVHNLLGRRALFPRDPQGGGTWVGVNDAGLIVALLNARAGDSTETCAPKRSRGLIVLQLLRCGSVREAMATAAALEADLFEPFRVVMVNAGDLAVAVSSGREAVYCRLLRFDVPVMLTSSSLGDAVAGPPRQRLFERMVLKGGSACWLQGQSRFHDHQWPGRPEISVRMERRDAHTVSRTEIEVTSRRRRLRYEAPIDTNRIGEQQWFSLP